MKNDESLLLFYSHEYISIKDRRNAEFHFFSFIPRSPRFSPIITHYRTFRGDCVYESVIPEDNNLKKSFMSSRLNLGVFLIRPSERLKISFSQIERYTIVDCLYDKSVGLSSRRENGKENSSHYLYAGSNVGKKFTFCHDDNLSSFVEPLRRTLEHYFHYETKTAETDETSSMGKNIRG